MSDPNHASVEPEMYRKQIEDILNNSDLSIITTKKVRHELEHSTGQTLEPIKKEINAIIQEIFLNLQSKHTDESEKQEPELKIEDLVVNYKGATPKKQIKKPLKATSKNIKKRPAEKKQREMPLLKVLPPLSNIIKTEYCSRTQTVSKMWDYIREHQLQDESDKRFINCDDYFKELCDGTERINAFTINKYLQKYFEKLSDEEQAARNPKKDEQPPAKKVKKNPRDMPIVKVLPPLSDIIKTNYCSRTQTVSKIWEYIREHNLQNPADKRLIDCDEKFKELCDGQAQISSFALNKYTQKCFVKIPEEEQLIIKRKLYNDQPQQQEEESDDDDTEEK
ncbi:hypothetical protein G6F37_007014 [Rhizopus arrhizus]|nr:hypothetical protein G6F38_006331 [Rhizopus arrhizus]KAG1157089.1 hypothetical protein G6F37_007014 [Rhizopus arrhizus]